MPDDPAKEYLEALERLKRGKPHNVPIGTRISNDSVALEAGRKKGAIKKCRPGFSGLIADITAAAEMQLKGGDETQIRLVNAKAEAARYRKLWEEALAREVSLLKELWNEREARRAGKIIPIRRSEPN